MVQGRVVSDIKEQEAVRDIFRKVSLCLQETEEKDSLIQVLAYEGVSDLCPVAAGCMRLGEEMARLLAVAVLPEYRGKSYGELLIRMLIDKAKTGGIQRMEVNCESNMTAYFRKLGFKSVDNTEINGNTVTKLIYNIGDRTCCCKTI